ncbi:unknown protein [Seminavis robusta]|uniref:Disease resistance R13L4/SHOC-2-like LRR domain-containing protein n=1 Tax=Seminavis robusta TaxID=568900 RepID=A0A9N8DFW3_9STRA|nr:unknown protein [Seminavis robusta]|eukprot:Sro105_g053231.1  (671) ;mRNA; r:57934-59946
MSSTHTEKVRAGQATTGRYEATAKAASKSLKKESSVAVMIEPLMVTNGDSLVTEDHRKDSRSVILKHAEDLDNLNDSSPQRHEMETDPPKTKPTAHPVLTNLEEGLALGRASTLGSPSPQSLPGAHAVAGIFPSRPPQPHTLASSALEEGQRTSNLAVANPVQEVVLARAEPQWERVGSPKTYPANHLLLVLCFVPLLIVAIAIPLTLIKGDSEQVSTATITPSAAPSEGPSSPGTPAPTGALDLLLLDLPKTSIENVHIFNTPQQQAYDWLLQYPNITGLENWRKKQLFALASFYYAMEGAHWRKEIRDNFLIYDQFGYELPEECYWFSSIFGNFQFDAYSESSTLPAIYVPCNGHGEFTTIFLSDLHLANHTPSIPEEIGLLTSLETLLLAYSGIHGNLATFLPPELYKMSSLTRLRLHENQLSGKIPSQIALLRNLEALSLHTNALTGSIPTHLGLLSNLTGLWLRANRLDGSIPKELASLSELASLRLDNNDLTGTVPSWLGLMTQLTHLNLHFNALTGTIPTQLALLTNLKNLTLSGNELTGGIPKWLGLLTSLIELSLGGNSFSGTIPSELAQLTNVQTLDLSNLPLLSGEIPQEFGLLTAGLGELNLTGSLNLMGAVPAELCFLQNSSCQFMDSYWQQMFDCFLLFDCTDSLRGCGCSCQQSA